MFVHDAPISSKDEDRLGRANFAAILGDLLSSWSQRESLVVGLFGPWGSGKTSLMNLALEQIQMTSKEREEKDRPIIISFNPWHFSGQEQLLIAFFNRLSSEIESHGLLSDEQRKKLRSYVETLATISTPVVSLVPGAREAMDVVTKLAEMRLHDRDVNQFRKDLDRAFQDFKRPVIIALDDIDRLTPEQIREVVQLVKLNANFPNTIFIIAADRTVLEKSLTTQEGIKGREYLEKIVQVGFDVPVVEQAYLSNVLSQELTHILSNYPPESFDGRRYAELHSSGFRALFNTLRDVKRYLNGLNFNLRLISTEVNIVDFIGIEALRTFSPDVYQKIARNKELFTAAGNWKNQNERLAQFEAILAADNKHASSIRAIAEFLFPQVQEASRRIFHSFDYGTDWRRERRICSPDVFDVYFLLSTPSGDVSQIELRKLLDIATQDDLTAYVNGFLEDGRFKRLLELIPDVVVDEADPQSALNVAATLLNVGERVPVDQRGMFGIEIFWTLARTVYQILLMVEQKERCTWLMNQVHRNSAVFTTMMQIAAAVPDEKAETDEEMFITEQCLEELRKAWVQRVSSEAEAGTLQTAPQLGGILAQWEEWEESEAPYQDFVNGMLSESASAAYLLSELLEQTARYSSAGGTAVYEIKFDPEKLERYADIDLLAAALESLTKDDVSKLPPRQAQAVKAFLDLTGAHQNNSLT